MPLVTTVQTGQSSFSHEVLETAYVSRACEGQGLLQNVLCRSSCEPSDFTQWPPVVDPLRMETQWGQQNA